MLYTGGMGNIASPRPRSPKPGCWHSRRTRLQRGGPLPYSDNDPSPGAGQFVAYTMGFYCSGHRIPDPPTVSLPAHVARRLPRGRSVPRHADDRVPRRRMVAGDFREADPQLGQGRRPVRARRQDEDDHREARRADLDVIQRGYAARRRAQIRQAGHDDGDLPGHSDLRRSRSAFRKPRSR